MKKSEENPTTKRGKCRAFWYKLRVGRCNTCGEKTKFLQYDHRSGVVKIENVSHYAYWACHGGVEAMQCEADKCDPVCLFCHNKKVEGKSNNHNIHKRKYATLDDMPVTTRKEKKARRQTISYEINF